MAFTMTNKGLLEVSVAFLFKLILNAVPFLPTFFPSFPSLLFYLIFHHSFQVG